MVPASPETEGEVGLEHQDADDAGHGVFSPFKGPPLGEKCSTWPFFLHHKMSPDL